MTGVLSVIVRGYRQARHNLRRVSVEQYDEAVRLRPGLCPLYVMGDERSGAQVPLRAHIMVWNI